MTALSPAASTAGAMSSVMRERITGTCPWLSSISKFTSVLLTGISPFPADRGSFLGIPEMNRVRIGPCPRDALISGQYTRTSTSDRVLTRTLSSFHSPRASRREHHPRQLPSTHLQFATGIQPKQLRPKSQGNQLSQ